MSIKDSRRFRIQGDKGSFARIKSLSKQFAQVAEVNEAQNHLTVVGEPKGYFKRKLDGVKARVEQEQIYIDPYDFDPYHGFC